MPLAELLNVLRNAVRHEKDRRLPGGVQLARQKSPVLGRLVRPDHGGLAVEFDFYHTAFPVSQIDNDIHTIPCHEAVLDPSFTRAQLQPFGIVCDEFLQPPMPLALSARIVSRLLFNVWDIHVRIFLRDVTRQVSAALPKMLERHPVLCILQERVQRVQKIRHLLIRDVTKQKAAPVGLAGSGIGLEPPVRKRPRGGFRQTNCAVGLSFDPDPLVVLGELDDLESAKHDPPALAIVVGVPRRQQRDLALAGMLHRYRLSVLIRSRPKSPPFKDLALVAGATRPSASKISVVELQAQVIGMRAPYSSRLYVPDNIPVAAGSSESDKTAMSAWALTPEDETRGDIRSGLWFFARMELGGGR